MFKPTERNRHILLGISRKKKTLFFSHKYAAFPSSNSLLFPLEPVFFPQIRLVIHISNPHCLMKKQLTSVTTRISRRAATAKPMTAPIPRPLKRVSLRKKKHIFHKTVITFDSILIINIFIFSCNYILH